MLIDNEFITNEISSMSEASFDVVVSFVLRELLNRNCVNVNGNGDGGCDFRELAQIGSRCELYQEQDRYGIRIVQVSVQKQGWGDKAVKDAQKAKSKFGAVQQFQFFTSRPRSYVELMKLSSKISSDLGIYAECFGARELASIIYEEHAFRRLSVMLNRSVPDDIEGKPTLKLRFLHSFFAFHSQRGQIRNEMYDVVILHRLYEKEYSSLEEIVNFTADFLRRTGREDEIRSRIDSLLNGKILKSGENLLLSKESKDDIQLANTSFDAELQILIDKVASALSQSGANVVPKRDEVIEIALGLAKLFAYEQCRKLNDLAGSAVVPLPIDFGREITINRPLLASGIKPVKSLRNRLIEIASGSMLVKRLANAVVYAWSEYGKGLTTVLVLGQYDWKRVDVILDANVAMPYFLSRYFAPTSERYSRAINEIVDSMQDRGCTVNIPKEYINECAGHLREAWEYYELYHERIEDQIEILQYSENAYVAHYCQMKCAHVEGMPSTFVQYISAISPYATQSGIDWSKRCPAIMDCFLRSFQNYNIGYLDIPRGEVNENRKAIETEYAYLSKEKGQTRQTGLVDHDVRVLSHLTSIADGRAKILLTNDDVVKSLYPKFRGRDVFVAGPADAGDLFRASDCLSEEDLKSLALTYASTSANPQCLAAKFIDGVIAVGMQKKQDWQMVSEIEQMTSSFVHDNLKKNARNIKQNDIEAYLGLAGTRVTGGTDPRRKEDGNSNDE